TYHDWRYITATEQASRPLMGHVVYEHVITNGSPSSTRIRREAIDWVGRTMRFESPDWGGGTNVEYHGYFGYPTKLLSSISRTTRPPQSQFENIPVDVFYYGIDGNTNLLVTLIDGIGDW